MFAGILILLTILFLIGNLFYFFTNKTFKKAGFDSVLFYNLFFVLLGLTLGFAFLYYLLSFQETVLVINDPTEDPAEPTFLNFLYFSGVTILSVGYGDLVPVGSARFFALMQAALGFLLPTIIFLKALNNSEEDDE
ncbi:potassium channel family protein [Bacillus sp. FJAT-44742]|uniref:potassium channel family protein n=1 Tax=Bacillus sp. FJAT-44742 TaxID=2014005 RepID=UPI000C2336E9|nr:potassium channel family protein [Bacillus sp. FJAT-44742]